MAIKAPKGTKDVLPEESYRWQYLESLIRSIVVKYGFLEARTPVIEPTELFLRGVGDTTDVVQKEMYTFEDKGGRSITLKPEGTAGVVRMFVENSLFNDAQPTKIFYLNNPVFRYERPQTGRLREHHQFGIEVFGAPRPSADAECIAVALELLRALGCDSLNVCINSIGCPSCRPAYHKALCEYIRTRYDDICETCKTRYEKNPLRILDCKMDKCKEIAKDAPSILDYLCDDCRAHFEEFQRLLSLMGIPFSIVPPLVRGLDYYTKTVFEIVSDCIGAQGTVCAGGRYDGLVEQLGGPSLPAVGFGLGMERLLLVMDQMGKTIEKPARLDLYIASLDADAGIRAFSLAAGLRARGCKVEIDHAGRSLKAQFKYADKLGAACVLTLGSDEIASGQGKLKRLSDGATFACALDASEIEEILKGTVKING